ncbi:MAG: inositol monophosphatase [Acidobacteria bacterium]|nr:inositol monophosphatase [Acidobacteriota bacterium]
MNRYLEQAIEIARQAGELLLREFHRGSEIEYKGEADIVTAADRRAEEFIVERLRTYFPQHAIVAEEGSRREAATEFCWYVDPLDGTTNFAHGYPLFAVSLALVSRPGAAQDEAAAGEEILVGVVHDPVRQETFSATRGEGAWLNQKRLRVSRTPRLAESLLSTGFPSRKRHESPNILYYHRFTLLSHGVRRDGSAALDLCYVASGRFDGFWEFNLKPWDTAAGVLLVREAGGLVTDFQGRPYRLGDDEIAASNGLIHSELQQVFAEIAARASDSRSL